MSALVNQVKQKLAKEGIRRQTEHSRDWLARNLRQLVGNIRTHQLRDNDRLTVKPKIGRMYMYYYDPKTKEDMPYYDRFPLIFVVNKYDDGFLGLNLHYLPPALRLRMLSSILDFANNDKFDEGTKLRLTWELLKSWSRSDLAKWCVKRYLYSQLQSKFIVVPPDEWEIAVFLPTERFEKAGRKQVWDEARNKLL